MGKIMYTSAPGSMLWPMLTIMARLSRCRVLRVERGTSSIWVMLYMVKAKAKYRL